MGVEGSLEANESINSHKMDGSGNHNVKWAIKYVLIPSIGFTLAYWLSFLWVILDFFSPLVLIIPAWLSDLMRRVSGLSFVSEILFFLPVNFFVFHRSGDFHPIAERLPCSGGIQRWAIQPPANNDTRLQVISHLHTSLDSSPTLDAGRRSHFLKVSIAACLSIHHDAYSRNYHQFLHSNPLKLCIF